MGLNRPEKIIIHHSLTEDNKVLSSFDGIRRYHIETNGWADIGYHHVLEYVGEKLVWRAGRAETLPGAHVKEQAINLKSIGICVVGNFDVTKPDAATYDALAAKCREIMGRYPRIKVSDIEPHHKYATYKSCPGKLFDMGEITKRLGAGAVTGFDGPARVAYKGKALDAGILEGKTFVELRALADLLGVTVAWDGTTKTVTLS